MFRSRWRGEKNKVKVVFKLQFQATQVPHVGRDTLMVSLIPVEVGKPTVRLEKTAVRDGICQWENPIYETVKFVQEPKTGKANEKIYQFIVSTGSSKSGVLGEASIDFADYVEAIKPSTVSLPLNSGAVLHVTIQRMHGAIDQRDVEENGDAMLNFEDKSLRRKMSNGTDENRNCNTTEDGGFNKTTIQNAESNVNSLASKGSDAISASTSESSSGRDTPRELGLRNNNNIHQDPTSLVSPVSHSSMPHRPTFNAITTNGQEHRRSNTEWSVGSGPEGSVDGSTNSSDDNLKRDLVVLARQAEVSELELQTLRKQIVKESKRGQDLSKEVVSLKEERDTLRKECEQLKASQKRADGAKVSSKLQFEIEDPWNLLQEIRQELNYEKDLNTNLRLQLQKTQEANSELILAVRDLDDMLEQKNKEISYVSNKSVSNENTEKMHDPVSKQQVTDDDEEQQALELLVKEHNDTKETYMLEQKIIDLYSELEVYRRDRDELEMQMEQLALDYEILKQENHDMHAKIEQNYLQEQLKMQCDNSASYSTMNELESQVEILEKELKEQKEEYSASLGTINEVKNQVKWLEKELEEQKGEASASLSTIDELKSQVKWLEKELEEQKEDASASLSTIDKLKSHVKWLEKELGEQKEEASASLNTVNELKSQVKRLEKELEEQKVETSSSLGTINELKSQIKWLEKELDEQAYGFENDLEVVTRAKVEQEQRAIRAEEALRKTRWNNANTAERLQEEFRRLSVQMTSTFDTNEKLAVKATTEANELRLQKIYLEEMLENASKDLSLVRDQYEEKLKQLTNQIDFATKRSEELLLEVDDKSKKLEHQQKNVEEVHEAFSKEILMLRAQIEKLKGENNDILKQAKLNEKLQVEMEKTEISMKDLELLVQRGNVEREELEKMIASVRKEAEKKSPEQLKNVRSVKGENEGLGGTLQSELEGLRTQCNDLKHTLYEDELEKENLRKQVFDLKVDLKKKEDKITVIEMKLKESSGRTTVFDSSKPNSKNNKSSALPRSSKEVASLREKIKLLEGQIRLKEATLENSNKSFLEKERDLSCRIEELENRMVELNQNSACCCEDHLQKEAGAADDISDIANKYGGSNGAERISDTEIHSKALMSEPNGDETAPIKSCDEGHLGEVLCEMEALKTRNKSMENELKDMQERYSEISLKFAEVEGERQQLVMSIRNLKNAKKS